ncbi:MAG: DUF4405 domain-containing protein [Selenomonadaceae bacterium]|nr:DUF4405 domain-containing protein [Selenomonadaceae bacterium]
MKKNFYLDVILFIAGLICIITGIMLDFHIIPGGREYHRIYREIHTYSGYVMAIGLIFHIVWHSSWIKNAFKQLKK